MARSALSRALVAGAAAAVSVLLAADALDVVAQPAVVTQPVVAPVVAPVVTAVATPPCTSCATCPGKSCPLGALPAGTPAGEEAHFICVLINTAVPGVLESPLTEYACWDSCDYVNHPASENWTAAVVPVLPVGATPALIEGRNKAIDANSNLQLTVKEIQTGKNLAITCPKKTGSAVPQSGTDWCPLETRCGGKRQGGYGSTGGTKHAQSVPKDRGICVSDPNGPFSRRCWDICDYSKKPSDYNKKGMTKNVETEVQTARDDGETCPSFNWWPWVIGLIVLIALCAGAAVFLRSQKRGKKGAMSSQKFDPVLDVPPPMHQADPAMEEPMPMTYEAPPALDHRPPSYGAPPADMERQLIEPPQRSLSRPESNANFGAIPGLTQPQLHMPSVQPQQMPQTYAQQALPRDISQAQPLTQTQGSFFPQTQSRPAAQGLYPGPQQPSMGQQNPYMQNPMQTNPMPQSYSQAAVPMGVSQPGMQPYQTQMGGGAPQYGQYR